MCKKLFCTILWLVVLAVCANTAQAQLDDLVGLWKFEEGSGDTALDRSGNGYHGTIVDAQHEAGGFDGTGFAMRFTGQPSSRVSVGTFDVEASGITLGCWLKADNLDTPGNDPRMISKATGGAADAHIFLLSSGRSGGIKVIRFRLRTDNGQATTTLLGSTTDATLVLDEWIHTAATWDGTTMRVYKNGLEAGSTARGGDAVFADSSVGVAIGNQPVGAEDRPFEGLLDEVFIDDRALSQEEIQLAMLGLGAEPEMAGAPVPADGMEDVVRDVTLSWMAGEYAATHNVYFGASFDDVNSMDAGVQVAQGLARDVDNLDVGRLEFGQTYYWRVEEVNGAPDFTAFPGDIWSFTVEPFSYPLTQVTATASSSHNADMGPEKTVDASGLDDMDQHGTLGTDMWLSGMGDAVPWIEYEFDRAYRLHQMLVWNSNQIVEAFIGLGAKEVTVETSLDGAAWTVLEGATLFNQATGKADYTTNTTIDFGGIMARYVRITIQAGHGPTTQYGLSEVRFMYIPARAREPQPADGAVTDDVNVLLAWRAGRDVATHEVLLSSDLAAVENASAVVGTTEESSFSPESILYDTTYYWQINEINEAEVPARHDGDIWIFSTPEFRVVDDFEGYNDDCDRIFFAWEDGFGHNGSEGIEDCTVAPYNGNGTGSIVGNASAPFAEQTIVNSGNQSMPLEYDTGVSETTLALDAQNWTVNGIQALSLAFHGDLGNTGQLYLKINNVEVPFNGNAAAISSPFWTEWIVELGTVGTDLTRVNALTIGIKGASAQGMLYVDDIRLYGQAPDVLGPQDPGSANLVAYYALENNAQDGSGNGHHGTVEGNPSWVSPGWNGTGACMQFGGDSDRITVESFDVTGSGITLTAWIKPVLFLNDARMISKSEGGSTNFHYWAMVLSGTGEDNLQFRLRTDVGDTTSRLSSGNPLTTDEWTHVAVAWDAGDPVMRQYKNGQEIDAFDKAGSAVATGPGVKVGIGNQSISALAQGPGNEIRPFEGLMDEVRVYSRGLSRAELLFVVLGQ